MTQLFRDTMTENWEKAGLRPCKVLNTTPTLLHTGQEDNMEINIYIQTALVKDGTVYNYPDWFTMKQMWPNKGKCGLSLDTHSGNEYATGYVLPVKSFFSFLMSLVRSSNLTWAAWKKSWGSGIGNTLLSVPAFCTRGRKYKKIYEWQMFYIVCIVLMWLTEPYLVKITQVVQNNIIHQVHPIVLIKKLQFYFRYEYTSL